DIRQGSSSERVEGRKFKAEGKALRGKLSVSRSPEAQCWTHKPHKLGCNLLRRGPGVRLARFDKRENRHTNGQQSERTIPDDGPSGEPLGSAEAATINVHVQ